RRWTGSFKDGSTIEGTPSEEAHGVAIQEHAVLKAVAGRAWTGLLRRACGQLCRGRRQAAGDCAVVEGCAEVGTRKLLRFDFLCWNPGDTAAHLGSPAANPQWFVWSPCHRHWHIKDFNYYRLLDCQGQVRVGRKQAFCLE